MPIDEKSPSPSIFLGIFIILSWFVYLSTLSPTVFYRDTPEFVNTAYTLGISHPAGFPLYNLLAKAVTFFPLGSIPFKVNLFSSLMGCLALWVLYWTSLTFLRVVAGPEQKPGAYLWPALLPVGFLAFSHPFWWNTMLAEVYTLHTLLTALIFLGLLLWKDRQDVRYLYSAACVYGLSAGNHGTVAFYLPSIVILFFCWCRQNPWMHLSRCVLFFLLGFSVYFYLPIRSLAEPTFDWGNPETLKGFLFQVTDRKDSHGHFAVINQVTGAAPGTAAAGGGFLQSFADGGIKAYRLAVQFLSDLQANLSYISGVGFVIGAALCFKYSRPFFLFLALIAGTNAAFFIDWRGEAFLPSYIVATLWTSLFLYQVLYTPWWRRFIQPKEDAEPADRAPAAFSFRKIAVFCVGMLIPLSLLFNYFRVDHSWNHLSESLTRKVYLTLPDRAVFITGLSWFFYNYNKDIRRLRDDVTAISVWEVLYPDPTEMMTRRRLPDLILPEEDKYDFKNVTGLSGYAYEFVSRNAVTRPVILEQCLTMYDETHFTSQWQPYRNLLLKFTPAPPSSSLAAESGRKSWQEFQRLMEEELKKPGSGRDLDWINNPMFWIYSFRQYFHDTQQYALEREVIELAGNFLGKRDLEWQFYHLDNLIQDGAPAKSEKVWAEFSREFPNTYEAWLGRGLLLKARGRYREALDALKKAAELRPQSFRVNLEMAATYRALNGEAAARAALNQAQQRLTNVRQIQRYQREVRRQAASWPAGAPRP
ncbi:MAG: DUF2723 domain-containing protein [Nitrospinaceae bacterium]|nr:DUF2723 domain-containing protein [Nitrospinaceae bacterium]NIR55711.1 DUF2723 domain-containing protein [Nitrospinaceae bacterium]NIS86155.1 DUF2723 domain-containing protein [Nitrospinaceae bacterium]NIT82999.1 DUF2723 domain-containing protein [Nitrospinaceae bacterium]NIU45203.1 DUF2723 domain-containing protein [Nitrospinaceae bacterium]